MVMFEFKGYCIVVFKGGRFLIYGMICILDVIYLMNLLFG